MYRGPAPVLLLFAECRQRGLERCHLSKDTRTPQCSVVCSLGDGCGDLGRVTRFCQQEVVYVKNCGTIAGFGGGDAVCNTGAGGGVVVGDGVMNGVAVVVMASVGWWWLERRRLRWRRRGNGTCISFSSMYL